MCLQYIQSDIDRQPRIASIPLICVHTNICLSISLSGFLAADQAGTRIYVDTLVKYCQFSEEIHVVALYTEAHPVVSH